VNASLDITLFTHVLCEVLKKPRTFGMPKDLNNSLTKAKLAEKHCHMATCIAEKHGRVRERSFL